MLSAVFATIVSDIGINFSVRARRRVTTVVRNGDMARWRRKLGRPEDAIAAELEVRRQLVPPLQYTYMVMK